MQGFDPAQATNGSVEGISDMANGKHLTSRWKERSRAMEDPQLQKGVVSEGEIKQEKTRTACVA